MDGDGLYHHVEDCSNCHDVFNAYNNLGFIKDTILTPNTGELPVLFTSPTGPNSFADGDSVYTGICEVCHTDTNYHQNSADGEHDHYPGWTCVGCHTHANEFHPGAPDHLEIVDTSGPSCVGCHDNPSLVDPDDSRSHSGCFTCHEDDGSLVVGGEGASAVAGGGDCYTCHGGPSHLMVYHNGWNQRHYVDGGYLACDQVMDTTCAGCHLPPLQESDYPAHVNFLVAVKYAIGDIHWGGSCSACHLPENAGLRSPAVSGGGDCHACHEGGISGAHTPETIDHSTILLRENLDCVGCHVSTALVDPDDVKVHNSCATCHNEDGTLVAMAITENGGGNCYDCHGGPAHLMSYHPLWSMRHSEAGWYFACEQVTFTECAGCHIDAEFTVEDYAEYGNAAEMYYLAEVKRQVYDIHGGGICRDCHTGYDQDPTPGQ